MTGRRGGLRLRRAGLALVMVGALSVSVHGQVEAVTPLLGGMSVVLALTNDLAALLALNELMATRCTEVRRWAWAVLVPAAGTAAGLNTWHAVRDGTLPPTWAVVVGIGPVLLAVVLSHLVALVLNAPPEAAATDTAEQVRSPRKAAAASLTAQQARPVALSSPGAHQGLTVVPSPPDRTTHGGRAPAAGSRPDTTGAPTRADAVADPRVQRLVAQLHGGAQLTGADVGRQLGCSPRTGRRLLRQAEDQLTVAAAAETSGRRWELSP